MPSDDETTVNLSDPQDIRAKLPAVERVVKEKQRAVQVAQADLQAWETLANDLARVVGVKRGSDPMRRAREAAKAAAAGAGTAAGAVVAGKRRNGREASAQEVAVGIVRSAGAPLTVAQVTERTDPPIKRETVGWGLWKAAKDGELKKVSQGLYAPPDYDSEAGTLLAPNGAADAADGGDDEN